MEMVKNIFRNTKKVIPEFCDFFWSLFLMTQDGKIMIFDDFWNTISPKWYTFPKMFFSGIHKYLDGHVLCLQFFDFRFRLDFSWGLLFVTFSLNTGPKKSLNENENLKTVHTIHDHQDTCEFQKKTFSEKCTILAKSCFKNHQKSWFFSLASSKKGTKKIAKLWDDFFSVSKYIFYHFHVSTQKKFLRVHTP